MTEDTEGTVFRDMIMLAMAGLIAILMLIISFINPDQKEAEEKTPPGNIIVEIMWSSGKDCDVDLWVLGPRDQPVGYSRKEGKLFNLLRDDLGKVNDITDLNYEVVYSRGIEPGTYTINVHMYRNGNCQLPLLVRVMVSVKTDPNSSARQLVTRDVVLRNQGEELTVFSFDLDAIGAIVPGTINHLYQPLRSGPK